MYAPDSWLEALAETHLKTSISAAEYRSCGAGGAGDGSKIFFKTASENNPPVNPRPRDIAAINICFQRSFIVKAHTDLDCDVCRDDKRQSRNRRCENDNHRRG